MVVRRSAPDALEGYTQSKPRISTLGQVPGCPRCKRPLTQFHDPWCPIGNGEALPPEAEDEKPAPLVVRYGQPTMAAEDVRPDRRLNVLNMPTPKQRKEPAPVPVIEVVPTQETDVAICKVCGPASRDRFSTRKDGSPYAMCKLCKAKAMKAHRYDGNGVAPPIPQAVADVTDMVEQAPDPEDMIPTKPVARFLPEPAVIDQAAPAPMPAEPFEKFEQLPPPIEDEIARAEQQLADLRDVAKIMEDDLPALIRWRRLVDEAIARKQVTA